MNLGISSRKRLLLAVVAGLTLSLALILHFVLVRPAKDNSVTIVSRKHVAKPITKDPVVIPGLPVRIKIPSISVDAAIDYVNLTAKGALAVPTGPANAAWYDLGPRPGQIGSAGPY